MPLLALSLFLKKKRRNFEKKINNFNAFVAMKKYLSPYSFSVLVGAVVVALLTGWYAFAFTPPQDPPPTCDPGDVGCDAPVNVGGTLQHKQGTLQVDYLKSHSDVDVADDITADGGTVLIYDGTSNLIKESVLPFKKGDLIAPGDRPLISGLGSYLTDYFNIANLGISGTSASNVKSGVSFGPGNSITGTASTGQPLLPGADVVAAAGLRINGGSKKCYAFSFGKCTGAGSVSHWRASSYSWLLPHDPRGGVLNFNYASSPTQIISGCYEDSSCKTKLTRTLKANNSQLTCNAPYQAKTSTPIYAAYDRACAPLRLGLNNDCWPIACYAP